jgi:hypothetical protein
MVKYRSNCQFNERSTAMNRRSFTAAALTAPLLSGCFYDRYFDIEWDEEVLLHDGRVIVVHVKRTYERRGNRTEKYPEHPRLVSMSFSFNAGKKIFQHTFIKGVLHFLDEKDGRWYIGYNADPGDPSVEIGTRMLYPHIAILNIDGSISKPESWNDVPAEIKNANILPVTPNPKVIAKFQGKLITVEEKTAHRSAYPTGAGWGTIQRITPKPINQGVKK